MMRAPLALKLATIQRSFTPWLPWRDRRKIGDDHYPGVYILARFRTPPLAMDVVDRRILYVGETTQRTLAQRLYEFERSAVLGKNGHSGGHTYATVFRGTRGLFVSALPVVADEPHLSAFIRATERLVLWAYVERHGAAPWCNRK